MDIRAWRGSTAKLYLALLFSPGHNGSQTSLMRAMGTTDHHTFRQAVMQLRELGMVKTTGGNHQLVVETTTPTGENHHTAVETTPVETTTTGGNHPDLLVETTNPRTRCTEADRSGNRTEQFKALSFAFSVRFPGHDIPSTESLLRLLQMCGHSAEAIDDYFERASVRSPKSPYSYVRKMMEGSPPVAIGPTRQSAQPPDDELREPTPEERAKWKADNALMRKLGILPEDEGDLDGDD